MRNVGLEQQTVLDYLKIASIVVPDPDVTIEELAKDAGLTLEEGQIFRDMAEPNNLETLDLLDLLRQGFEADK